MRCALVSNHKTEMWRALTIANCDLRAMDDGRFCFLFSIGPDNVLAKHLIF